MKIAVLCPSRDRPEGLKRLVDSVKATSSADVLAYVDKDQDNLYWDTEGLILNVGEQIGPVAAANLMVERFPSYDAYGLVTDDSVITTPGWDKWLEEYLTTYPLMVISPYHNHGNHVDMPFVSRRWIETVGWFACPAMMHYAWPIVTGLIGEMTAICHAPKQSFAIDHDYVEGTHEDRRKMDNEAFFNYVSLRLPAAVERVRQAMS